MASSPKWMPTSYEVAEKTLGNRDTKKIGNNTQLYREVNGEALAVAHHHTTIVWFYKDGTIAFRPYNTHSTKARLNAVKGGVRFFTKKHQLMISYKGVTFPASWRFEIGEASEDLYSVE